MPAVTYYDLGHNRPMHQLVFAGTHDAGITGGADNAQTQDLEIYGQAVAGARIFDLRVAAAALTTATDGTTIIQMKTFHADPKLMTEKKMNAIDIATNAQSRLTRTKLRAGEWGLSLTKVLMQAKSFVTDHPTEFLLLKFDKCKNWNIIAQACIDVLGTSIYSDGGNLNTKTLFDLRGKVIPLFSAKGALATRYNYTHGINVWKNLKAEDEPGAAYLAGFNGLQYFGGGGTDPLKFWKGKGSKIDENESTQKKKMMKMAQDTNANAPEVLGMMYWTSTGLKQSIRERDAVQWNQRNMTRLQQLWNDGLEESISTRLPSSLNMENYSAAGFLKVFMPNFVMVDFIDQGKGNFIKSLNAISATELTGTALRGRIVNQAQDAGLL